MVEGEGALGRASHFNIGDPVHALLYALMGIGAVTLLASKIPLAIEIARRPVPGMDRSLHLAVALGLAMTIVLGTATGIAISANQGPALGRIGAGLPLLGWNRAGGDLRVAHFLGLHGEQILPLVALALAGLGRSRRTWPVALAAFLLCSLTLFAWARARFGRRLIAVEGGAVLPLRRPAPRLCWGRCPWSFAPSAASTPSSSTASPRARWWSAPPPR